MTPADLPPWTADRAKAAAFREALAKWYRANARALPWRALPGEASDPWRVLVSEIMLQQTTVATVSSRFGPFLERWPTPAALAEAPEEAVLDAWSGLGYYSRARRLREAAKVLARLPAPPETASGWRALPGVGEYTAAAVASICFGEPALAFDANLSRVLARLVAERRPPAEKAAQDALKSAGRALLDWERPGGFNQSLMDLGAMVCQPRKPRCEACPVASFCEARRLGLADSIPAPKPKKAGSKEGKLHRRDVAMLLARPAASGPGEEIFLWRRPDAQVYAGMWELPTWRLGEAGVRGYPPGGGFAGRALSWLLGELALPGQALRAAGASSEGVRHSITVYKVALDVLRLEASEELPFSGRPAGQAFPLRLAGGLAEGRWASADRAAKAAQASPHKRLLEKLFPAG